MSDIEPCRFNEPGGLTVNELVGMIQDGGESLRFAHAELIRRNLGAYDCGLALKRSEARVAELEGERNRALGVASGHMRKDASGIIGTVSELLRERNKAESRVEELQAQLDRANTSLKDWKQRAARMALKAKPLLDRATEPRADGKCT